MVECNYRGWLQHSECEQDGIWRGTVNKWCYAHEKINEIRGKGIYDIIVILYKKDKKAYKSRN